MSIPLFPHLHTADPAAHVFRDGRLWLYADRDPDRVSKYWMSMCDYHAFSTDDLKNWIHHGSVLSCDDISWCGGAAWDGDCIERNGRFWYFFPMIDQIGVAVADRPQGPFRDAIGHPLITRQTPGVRPRKEGMGFLVSPVFVESPDGLHLYFGQNDELYVARIQESLLELDGPVRQVLQPEVYHEGPWVFFRNGKYHMVYGKGAIAETLEDQRDNLAYAVATSPEGPFLYQHIIQPDPGRTVQACLVEWQKQDILFYHIDGYDNYHRKICAELCERPADGGVGVVPRGSHPLVPQSVLLDAAGLHMAEDFHESEGRVERRKAEFGRCGFVRMEQGSSIHFDHWIATTPVKNLECTWIFGENETPPSLVAEIDGVHQQGSVQPDVLPGNRRKIVFPLPRPISGQFGRLTLRLEEGAPCDLRDLRFC